LKEGSPREKGKRGIESPWKKKRKNAGKGMTRKSSTKKKQRRKEKKQTPIFVEKKKQVKKPIPVWGETGSGKNFLGISEKKGGAQGGKKG